jgi:hypothetical protein
MNTLRTIAPESGIEDTTPAHECATIAPERGLSDQAPRRTLLVLDR